MHKTHQLNHPPPRQIPLPITNLPICPWARIPGPTMNFHGYRRDESYVSVKSARKHFNQW